MAPIPGGVRFTGFVSPSDTTDTYYVTDPLYGKGGYREVASLAERDAITTERRRIGMLVYVQADQKVYCLKTGLTNLDWVEFNSGSGGTITIPATRIPFGDANNNLLTSPNLVWNNNEQFLQLPGLVLTSEILGEIFPGKLQFDGSHLYFSLNATERYKVMLEKTVNATAYNIANWVETRSANATDSNFDALVNIVATIINDLKTAGIFK